MSNDQKREAKEILEDVLATFAVLIEEHFDDIDPFKIVWQTNTKDFCNGDLERFGKAMIDFHLIYQVTIDYEAYTEFDIFPTLEHAYNYIVDKVLIKKGFNPKTLLPS